MMKRGLKLVLAVALLMALAAPALASYGAVLNTKVRLYEDPMMTDKAGTASKYTAVVVKETRSGVAQIKHEGKTYYIPEAALSRPWEDIQKEMDKLGVDLTWQYNRFLKKGCYAYTSPKKGTTKKRLKQNMVVWAIYEKGDWTLVACGDYYGYIKTKYLEKKDEQKALTGAELDRIKKKEEEREALKLAKLKAKQKAALEKARQEQAKREEEAKKQEEAQQQEEAQKQQEAQPVG